MRKSKFMAFAMLMALFLAASGSDQQKKIYWGKEVPDGRGGEK